MLARALRIALAGLLALTLSLPAEAMNKRVRNVVMSGGSSVFPGVNRADLNFATGSYYKPGATGPLADFRTQPETCVDASGTWHQVPGGVPCITNLGLSSWEARTNYIRNNTMAGAVVGTPGTLPTNWNIQNCAGLSSSVIGFGTTQGLPYIDIRYFGTAAGACSINTQLELDGTIPAGSGLTYELSMFSQLVGGSTANISSMQALLLEFNGGSAINFESSSSSFWIPNGTLTRVPPVVGVTLPDPNVTTIRALELTYVTGAGAVDITLRLAAPQLESTDPIILPSSASAGVVATGGAGCTNGGPQTFTASGGVLTSQNPTGGAAVPTTLTGTVTTNVLAGALTIVQPGNYSTYPPNPTTFTGAGCATPPTVTITYYNGGNQTFASPPIMTSGAFASRDTDGLYLPLSPCPGSYSLWGAGTPAAPNNYPEPMTLANIDNGTHSNRLIVARWFASGTNPVGSSVVADVRTDTNAATPWAQNTPGVLSAFVVPGALSEVFNHAAAGTAVPASFVPALNELSIGANADVQTQWNGVITRVAASCNSLLGD